MFNTGIFVENCWEWNQRTADNKTLPDLKTFFAAAHREWRLSLQNETGTPYSNAHNAPARSDDRYLHQETVGTIANLATATAINRAAIAQLTATVERLTSELVTVNTKLVAALKTQQSSRGGNVGRSWGRGRGASAVAGASSTTPTHGPPTGAGTATRTEKQDLEPPIHYCWTCVPGCRQNSAKCHSPTNVHIYMATRQDMQGGAEAQK